MVVHSTQWQRVGDAGLKTGVLKSYSGEFSLKADGGGAEVSIKTLETSDSSLVYFVKEGQKLLQGLYVV
jgi:hypothetical protein